MSLILTFIFKHLKKGDKSDVEDAIAFMDDLGITNDHLKEHLMTLSMDKKIVEAYDALPS